jgi:hypothetical protein
MNTATACVTSAPRRTDNPWIIDSAYTHGTEIRADSWCAAGFTLSITTDAQVLAVYATSLTGLQQSVELMSRGFADLGIDSDASMVPSLSDCGQYLYASLADLTIQAKLESEGVIVDVFSAEGECLDTGTVDYCEISFAPEPE